MEDIEESAADGGGQDVVLVAAAAWADPSQSQEHCQWRTHAEEVLHLHQNDDINVLWMEWNENVKIIDLTLNLRAGGVEGLEASRVSSWFSSSRNLK